MQEKIRYKKLIKSIQSSYYFRSSFYKKTHYFNSNLICNLLVDATTTTPGVEEVTLLSIKVQSWEAIRIYFSLLHADNGK